MPALDDPEFIARLRPARRIDLVRSLKGQKFGKLRPVEFLGVIGKRENTHAYWKAHCDCGRVIAVKGVHMTTGDSLSCGCDREPVGWHRTGIRSSHNKR